MTATELTDRALALPVEERVMLAQRLWDSLDDDGLELSSEADAHALDAAQRRDAEWSRGEIAGRPHREVIDNARQELS